MTDASHFWEGFEKRAISLTGMMGGLRSGNKAYSARGALAKPAPLKNGISVAPRAVPPVLPTPVKIHPNQNLTPKPVGKSLAVPNIPKPAQQSARGVSSTNI